MLVNIWGVINDLVKILCGLVYLYKDHSFAYKNSWPGVVRCSQPFWYSGMDARKVSEKKDMPLFENNEKYLVQKNVFISFKYLKSA